MVTHVHIITALGVSNKNPPMRFGLFGGKRKKG